MNYKHILLGGFAACALLSAYVLRAADEPSAFLEFQRLIQAADPVAANAARKRDHPDPLSKEEAEAFKKGVASRAIALMDKTADLEKQFPQSTHLSEARASLKKTLAIGFGFMEMPIPADRTIDVEARARELLKNDGDNTGLYLVLFRIAARRPPGEQRARFQELSKEPTSEPALSMAKAALRNLERVGTPLALRFTALDGHLVDLRDLKGKVVLIDFWAPSCGPCVQDLPDLKRVYSKYKKQGFEIVGISLDPEEKDLERFVQTQQLPWPIKYDGSDSTNRVADNYGIAEIPVVWLLDRRGILRDLNGREDQAKKIEALLGAP